MDRSAIFAKIRSGNFESSSSATEEWISFYKSWKSYLNKILKPHCSEIEIDRGHFYSSGFVRTSLGSVFYFSTGDVRSPIREILIRTAKDFKDFTGGSNNYIKLDDDFETNLLKFINRPSFNR